MQHIFLHEDETSPSGNLHMGKKKHQLKLKKKTAIPRITTPKAGSIPMNPYI